LNNFELEFTKDKITNKKWFPYNKGGGYQKFYGNNEFVCDWENNGENVKNNLDTSGKPRSVIRNSQYYFKEGITFNLTGNFSARYKETGFLFDVQGSSLFPDKELLYVVIALLNSKLVQPLLRITNPTLVTQVGDLKLLPVAFEKENNLLPKLSELTKNVISIYKDLWDSNETSWNFKKMKFRFENNSLREILYNYGNGLKLIIEELRNKECEINRLLIDIYGLKNEFDPTINYNDLTLSNNKNIVVTDSTVSISIKETFNNIFSYSVGVLFGRFSANKEGIILSNQGESSKDFLKQVPSSTFMPDEDNIIPVLDGEWFNDDIVGRFKLFIKVLFGEEYFEENLAYIEETIDKDIRKYFVKDFYNDHIKRYKKRPIYWMFSSPKGHFKALIYMHRYQPDLCSKMLNDYLQPFISKLEAAKQNNTLLSLREDVSAREKTVALKEVDRLELIIRDCKDYERTLFAIATQKITIDLDDGVKVNYLKFKEVLVPIKGLEKEED
jgi:hypothetical protein